jgi:excisionase family DNA binding protein
MSNTLSDFPDAVRPTESEAQLARESSRQLAKILAKRKQFGPARLVVGSRKKGEEISIPASAFRLLGDILSQMAQGHAVSLISVHAELTTQQAADLLNVSRPFLVVQLDKGIIPFRKVGTHRRVLLKDVMHYKQSIDRNRLKSLEELSALDQELGLGY